MAVTGLLFFRSNSGREVINYTNEPKHKRTHVDKYRTYFAKFHPNRSGGFGILTQTNRQTNTHTYTHKHTHTHKQKNRHTHSNTHTNKHARMHTLCRMKIIRTFDGVL